MGGDTKIDDDAARGDVTERDLEAPDTDTDAPADAPADAADAAEVAGAEREIDLIAAARGEDPVRWVHPQTEASAGGDEADDAVAVADGEPAPRATETSLAVIARRDLAPSTGWRTAAVVGLVVAGLLIAANVILWGKIDGVEDDLTATRAEVITARGEGGSQVQTVGERVDALEQQLADLQASVDDLQASVGGAASPADVAAQVAAVQARADQITTCVNTYMDVLGGWTRNIDSTFTYVRC
jgi:hypothetical protein